MKTNQYKYRKMVYSTTLILWMLLIFVFSSNNAEQSSKSSNIIANSILNILSYLKIVDINNITEQIRNTINSNIRMFAHFFEYFILGILSLININLYFPRLKLKALFAFIFCLGYAFSDEIHQYFIPGRVSEIFDILVDSCGITLGIFLAYLKSRKQNLK